MTSFAGIGKTMNVSDALGIRHELERAHRSRQSFDTVTAPWWCVERHLSRYRCPAQQWGVVATTGQSPHPGYRAERLWGPCKDALRLYIRGYLLSQEKPATTRLTGVSELGKKRVTTHNGRGRGGRGYGAKHNDRNFDVTLARNIDQALMQNNHYWCIKDGMSFEAAEIEFYKENFSEQLQEVNDGYIKNRHKEKCKTMEQWKMLRRNAPEESLFQIGKKHDEKGNIIDEYISGDLLLDVFSELNAFELEWNEEHGNPFTVLSIAHHADEPNCPDHLHVRRVWHYRDENGSLRVGQEKALEQAGVELPNPSKPEGRYNNRKITYDKMIREKLLDICESRGIEIERVPVPGRKASKELEDYVRDKNEKMINETAKLERGIEELNQSTKLYTKMEEEASKSAYKAHQDVLKAKEEVNTLKAEQNTLQGENEALRKQGAKLHRTVSQLAELKTMSEYQAQVIDNDKVLEDVDNTLQAISKQAAADGCSENAIQRILRAALNGMANILDALRIQITRVQLFEQLHRIVNAVGKKQENTFENILANAYGRSAETDTASPGKARDEIEKI